MIVLTSIVASVGAAGIPEAGLVTMTLVFTAVGLAGRIHRLPAHRRLVPRPLPHDDQRHGRRERELHLGWEDETGGLIARCLNLHGDILNFKVALARSRHTAR